MSIADYGIFRMLPPMGLPQGGVPFQGRVSFLLTALKIFATIGYRIRLWLLDIDVVR
jgi:hypothetical protein